MSEREGQLSEAIKQKEVMEDLLLHPGWKMIEENLDAQIDERTNRLEEPLESADLVFMQEYTKGARQSFRLIKNLPKSIIEQASDVVEAITEEMEELENGEEESNEGEGGNNGDGADSDE